MDCIGNYDNVNVYKSYQHLAEDKMNEITYLRNYEAQRSGSPKAEKRGPTILAYAPRRA